MRRTAIHHLTSLACLAVATALLGGCLASGGTATIALTPTPQLPTPTLTHTPAPVTATAPVSPTPTPSMPDDFAFLYFQDFCEDVIQIDTFRGTYYAQVREGSERDRVSLALTPEELLVYYREIVALDPFSLPEAFPRANLRWPRVEYGFIVRMNGQMKSLYWEGNAWPGTPTAAEPALRRFASSMGRLVQERPELRELRSHGVGCT